MLRLVRLGFPLAAATCLIVACATQPPPPVEPPPSTPVVVDNNVQPPAETPPISVVQAATEAYHSAADAPLVLAKIQSSGTDPASLSVEDQGIYANLLLATGKYKPAAEMFRHVLEIQAGNKDALTALVLLTGLDGDTSSQKALIDELVYRYPTDTDVLNLQAQNAFSQGDSSGARSAWEASIQSGPTPDALVGLAMLALQTKKTKDAIALLNRAEGLTQANDLLYSLRSQAYTTLGEYLLAENDLTHAITLMPENSWYYLDRARLNLLNLKKPVQALADAEQALSLDSSLFYAWEYKAEILESQGKAKEAYQAYRKALALEKNFRFSYPAVATLAFRLQDYPQAILSAHEAAKDFPGEYAFPIIEALSLRFLGKKSEAQTVLEKNQSRFPRGTTVNELYRFLLAPENDTYLNAALSREPKENIRVRVQFYQACQYVALKAYSSARAGFQLASESRLPGIPEIAAARDWLDHGF